MTAVDLSYAEDWFTWFANQARLQIAHPRHLLILVVGLAAWLYWAWQRGFDDRSINALIVPTGVASYAFMILILAAAVGVELRAEEQNQQILELENHIWRLEQKLAAAQGISENGDGH